MLTSPLAYPEVGYLARPFLINEDIIGFQILIDKVDQHRRQEMRCAFD